MNHLGGYEIDKPCPTSAASEPDDIQATDERVSFPVL